MDKELDPSIMNRRIFPIVKQLKTGNFEFDDMLFNIINGGNSTYRKIIENGEYAFPRLFTYLKKAKPVDVEEEQEQEINNSSSIIMKKVTDVIPDGNKNKVRDAIKSYLTIAKQDSSDISSGNVSNDEIEKITVRITSYNVCYTKLLR